MQINVFVMGGLALLVAATFLILSMPKFNERLAFLAAICGAAVAISIML